MTKVSIIIPSYNVENYINDALKSVFEQTFSDYEIICVDDCSTDRTYSILKLKAKNNKKLKIIRNKKKLGPGECRNIALSNAIGEYIVCLDSDDIMHKNLLETVVNKLDNIDVPALWYKYEIFWEEENFTTPMFPFPILKNEPDGFLTLTPENITNYPAYSWNKVLRRNSIKNNIFWSKDYLYEDVEFYYRYYTQNPNIYIINQSLYTYRRRKNSIISNSTQNINHHKNLFKVTENIYNFLIENNLFNKYKKAFLKLFIQNIHEFDSFDNIKKELANTVNKSLKNINFPENYKDLIKKNYDFSAFKAN